MDKFIELLKKMFGGDADKMKMLDEFKIDKQDASNLTEMQKALADLQKSMKVDPPASAFDDKDVKATIAGLSAQIKTLQDSFADQNKRQEDREKAIQEDAKKNHEKKIEEAIQLAVKSGKIPAKNDSELAKWKSLFEKDFDSAEFALSKIKELKSDTTPSQQPGHESKTSEIQKGLGSSLKSEYAKYVENIPLTTD